MRLFFFSLLILTIVTLAQPALGWIIGPLASLVNFTPILVVFWASQAETDLLVWLIFLGGLWKDFLVADIFGFGPAIWGIVAIVSRTQRVLLRDYGHFFTALVNFAATFLYLSFDRFLFLIHQQFWSWNTYLSFHIFIASLINAIISPFVFALLKPLYGVKKEENFAFIHGSL